MKYEIRYHNQVDEILKRVRKRERLTEEEFCCKYGFDDFQAFLNIMASPPNNLEYVSSVRDGEDLTHIFKEMIKKNKR